MLGAVVSEARAGGHPSIGEINARDLTNADVLALPDRERDAWIHGAVVMMAQSSATLNIEKAQCIMDWYFGAPHTHGVIVETMKDFSESRAGATIFGMANTSCGTLN